MLSLLPIFSTLIKHYKWPILILSFKMCNLCILLLLPYITLVWVGCYQSSKGTVQAMVSAPFTTTTTTTINSSYYLALFTLSITNHRMVQCVKCWRHLSSCSPSGPTGRWWHCHGNQCPLWEPMGGQTRLHGRWRVLWHGWEALVPVGDWTVLFCQAFNVPSNRHTD